MTDHRQINFRLSRSRTIAAPATAVFPLIASFHEWQKWSPWEGVDPDLKRTFTGPDSGLGARYEWSGNKKAGAGTMEVIEADDPTLVVVDLRFLKPFKAENLSTFTLAEKDGETRVDWVMTGHRNLFLRVLARIIPIDKEVGKDFERGLESLAAAATRNSA